MKAGLGFGAVCFEKGGLTMPSMGLVWKGLALGTPWFRNNEPLIPGTRSRAQTWSERAGLTSATRGTLAVSDPFNLLLPKPSEEAIQLPHEETP